MRMRTWEPDAEVTSGSRDMWGDLGVGCLPRWLVLVPEVNTPGSMCGEVPPFLGERKISLTKLEVKREEFLSDELPQVERV